MIREFIKAFLLIFAAEMGDKTQIIAMTFATQYKVKEVLLGVFLGVFLNHGIAILLGRYLSKLIPMDWIQLIAGFMFVLFGLIALKEEKVEDEKEKNYGPIITVALAFFVGELGDKTQLTAMTLSAEGMYPVFILLGTTLGMIVTSGLGIYVGSKIGEKIPDIFIKIISSVVFVSLGTLKLYNLLLDKFVNIYYIGIYLLIILSVQIILARRLIYTRKYLYYSPMKEAASNLYIQTKLLDEAVDKICLGERSCGKCLGENCIVGYTKDMLKKARENEEYYIKKTVNFEKLKKKDFCIDKVIDALSLIVMDYMKYGIVENDKFVINQARESLEIILFDKKIEFNENLSMYLERIEKTDKFIGRQLKSSIANRTNNVNNNL
ncbi:putative Ca2+/H+ antiporter (TMEM165/GDT1 family) [Keratinibaculum paraultunense]|uniref:GDT1 family protein n=1 Tax=Keratinibaculum paraultunense TaxID=1278232 RepID=A0A4R3KRE6_9FIRM|nr:TMEM165/GDT1 family protein [Keratinibaculum paraultunense]QQY78784.1 TMEM165/GDT1 family protein [Keratinibaculum paraultunense]TCS87510.1 putative Ca2+/H+ antiporter (TMEM165/GDT1 family) [Keratinibaculum paraultunense]